MDQEQEQKTYGKRPLWQWIVLYIIIGGILYAGVYYFILAKKNGYNYTQNQSVQYQTQPTTASSGQATPLPSLQEVTVEGNEFAFAPATITVKQGETVRLTFKNTGKYPHNFAVSDLNVQTKTVQPGETDTIEFTPNKTGSFSYVCTVDSHADKGMKGTLMVQ